jgi:hypothetical protein
MDTLNLILQEGPPDTSGYMLLGYGIIFGVLLLHLASLALRRRNFEQELELLQELKGEKKGKANQK